MKAIALLLLAIFGTACAPQPSPEIDPAFIGVFRALGVDSGEELQIQRDGVYHLKRIGFGSQHAKPIEGHWKVAGDAVQIRAFDGRWTLKLVEDGRGILIAENGSRMQRVAK